ncbi:MAG TPA: hypothetical protein P5232_01600 [Candidatus Moranbacteria bacterium]|nr:hypothetical protein [Candidatus Moranbacteria bacterium]
MSRKELETIVLVGGGKIRVISSQKNKDEEVFIRVGNYLVISIGKMVIHIWKADDDELYKRIGEIIVKEQQAGEDEVEIFWKEFSQDMEEIERETFDLAVAPGVKLEYPA